MKQKLLYQSRNYFKWHLSNLHLFKKGLNTCWFSSGTAAAWWVFSSSTFSSFIYTIKVVPLLIHIYSYKTSHLATSIIYCELTEECVLPCVISPLRKTKAFKTSQWRSVLCWALTENEFCMTAVNFSKTMTCSMMLSLITISCCIYLKRSTESELLLRPVCISYFATYMKSFVRSSVVIALVKIKNWISLHLTSSYYFQFYKKQRLQNKQNMLFSAQTLRGFWR